MKLLSITLLAMTALLFSCDNQKKESAEEGLEKTVKTETVVTEAPKGNFVNAPQLMQAGKLKSLLTPGNEIQLIDVRTPEEFAEGHLEGAVNINIEDADFRDRIMKLEREEPVVLYCRSGGRSARAANVVAALGYRAYDLDKGIQGWEKQDFPVVK